MYLSRVEIDVKNRRKIRDLTHLGAYHSWVEQSFPDEKAAGIRTRKLWRVDHLHGVPYLLVVSEQKPDAECLEKYGVKGSAQSKKYDGFLNRIEEGRKYQFRVTLNPVHAVSTHQGMRGKIYPEVTAEQQMNFLKERAEKNGFFLRKGEYRITERKYEVLKKKNGRPIRISKVSYEGILTVKDTNLFQRILKEGLGREKAYGCGMMTIIPEVES